jgi:hypothetical protein
MARNTRSIPVEKDWQPKISLRADISITIPRLTTSG